MFARAFPDIYFLFSLAKVFKVIRLERTLNMPVGYEETFTRADLTFKHQRVFCPRTRTCVPLTPFAAEVNPDTVDFLGPYVSYP